MRQKIVALLALMLLGISSQKMSAQNIDFNKSPEDFFGSYVHKKDTAFSNQVYIWDTFGKRFSLHANVFEWAITVPNIGVEFDLDETKMNNRSILLFGKYNPNTKHDIKPRFVFNLGAVRAEFRKYWRTGKVSYNYYHSDYELLHIVKPDTLFREVTTVNEFGQEEYHWEPYFSPKDSLKIGTYNGDSYRHMMYNRYHNIRRLISGRTINNARNWRAYYAGAFLGYDRYSYCWGKHGEQGHILAVGATAGWSIPLIASSYPHEGGLDLDLGVNVGLPFAKWEGYKYVDKDVADYGIEGTRDPYYQAVASKSSSKWKVNPKYILQDIHISLVYRFRSIGKKVSLDIVDEYEEKEIQKFRDRANSLEEAINRSLQESLNRMDSLAIVDKNRADSAEWADYNTKRRLEAMLEMDPDTTQFHGRDSVDYIRLILGRDTTEYRKIKEAQVREARQLAKAYEDSVESVRLAFQKDSARTAKLYEDSIAIIRRAFTRDSLRAVKDSLRREKAKTDSIEKAMFEEEQARIRAEEEAIRAEQEAQRAEAKRAREEAKNAMRKERMAIKAEQDRAKREIEEEERRIRELEEAERRKLDPSKKTSLEKKAEKMANRILERSQKTTEKLEKQKAEESEEAKKSSEEKSKEAEETKKDAEESKSEE